MKKMMNWVLAATFICGASVFTSCSANDANDNPSQEQAKENRKEFIQTTQMITPRRSRPRRTARSLSSTPART